MPSRALSLINELLVVAKAIEAPVKDRDGVETSSYDLLLKFHYPRLDTQGPAAALAGLITHLNFFFAARAVAPMNDQEKEFFARQQQKFKDVCYVLEVDPNKTASSKVQGHVESALLNLG